MVDTVGHSDRAGVDDAQHLEALGSHRWRDPSCLTIRTWQSGWESILWDNWEEGKIATEPSRMVGWDYIIPSSCNHFPSFLLHLPHSTMFHMLRGMKLGTMENHGRQGKSVWLLKALAQEWVAQNWYCCGNLRLIMISWSYLSSSGSQTKHKTLGWALNSDLSVLPCSLWPWPPLHVAIWQTTFTCVK